MGSATISSLSVSSCFPARSDSSLEKRRGQLCEIIVDVHRALLFNFLPLETDAPAFRLW
jgi:hypothetical protein